MIDLIKNFNEVKFITSEIFNNLLEEVGKENIVFTIFDNDKPEIKRNYVMVDRSEIQKYSPNYKIYLLSLDLQKYDYFYVSDFCQLIRSGCIKVNYRWDVLMNEEIA